MAAFKMAPPPERTGDAEIDLNRLYSYVAELYAQVKYVFYNIDEENISETLLSTEE